MDYKKIIEDALNNFIGHSIVINCDLSSTSGILHHYVSKDYYYQLVLKCGRYKKKIIVFYPFDVKFQKGVLNLDYRISKLYSELMYNISRNGDEHLFFDKIVHICELT